MNIEFSVESLNKQGEIHKMEEKLYQLGLFEANKLHDDGSGVLCYEMKVKDDMILLECNTNENTMRMMKRKINEDHFEDITENEIEKGVRKKIHEDGSRWEGDWYTEKPFGFGNYYDGDGNRIYTGFVFDGKKVGFGTEYFADVYKVDYCGNFMNDQRHGWGITYDKNGNKLFEGDWRFGKNDFEDRIEE